jgi:hypothetical protein
LGTKDFAHQSGHITRPMIGKRVCLRISPIKGTAGKDIVGKNQAFDQVWIFERQCGCNEAPDKSLQRRSRLSLLRVTIATNGMAVKLVGDLANMTEVYETLVARLPIATESVGLLFVLQCSLLSQKPE